MKILDELIAEPGAAIFLALTFWLASMFLLRSVLSDLLKMHKSKTALKKIEKQYSVRQKLCLHHVAAHTEHAVRFTRYLIWVHHASGLTMLLCLLLRLFLPDQWFVYLLAGRFLVLDIPVMVLDFVLDEHPFRKHKHRYRFLKYHNTSDKTSLL